MAYAEKTKVTIFETVSDIERIVRKHGGEQFVYGVGDDRGLIAFTKEDRQVRFIVPFGDADEQRRKSLMRALFLTIKARLEGAEAGVESFEQAFLAQIVLPDGRRVGDMVREELVIAYEGGKQPPHLLPDYSR